MLAHQFAVQRRRLRLALERPDRTSQLDENVVQPGQVVVDALYLPKGSVFAAAELADLRRLLDERPALFGPRLKHRIELALTNDGMDAATDARVGQQFGDIQKPACGSVDPVLGGPCAIGHAGDGHFVEIERQDPRSVVEGQLDLGHAQTATGIGSGEDHVVHRSASERRGRLRAQHPAQGIRDVRFAGPVRADHDVHSRDELEDRAVGERLEPGELQGFYVHKQQPSRRSLRDPGIGFTSSF